VWCTLEYYTLGKLSFKSEENECEKPTIVYLQLKFKQFNIK